jgi:hypothetical protein
LLAGAATALPLPWLPASTIAATVTTRWRWVAHGCAPAAAFARGIAATAGPVRALTLPGLDGHAAWRLDTCVHRLHAARGEVLLGLLPLAQAWRFEAAVLDLAGAWLSRNDHVLATNEASWPARLGANLALRALQLREPDASEPSADLPMAHPLQSRFVSFAVRI